MSGLLTTFLNGFVIVVLIFSALIERNELRAQGFAPLDQPSLEEILNSPNPEFYRPGHRQGFEDESSENTIGKDVAEPDWQTLGKEIQQWMLTSILELGQKIMHRHSPPMYPLIEAQKPEAVPESITQIEPRKKLIIAPYKEPFADLSL